MLKQGTFSKEGKSIRLFSVNTLERCAFFYLGGYMPQKRTIERSCKKCNKTFKATAYAVKIGKALYCSRRCSMLGRTPSNETLVKMSLARKGIFGENANGWKGENAKYVAKHMWIAKHYGKAEKCTNPKCEYKNPKRYHWANVSGKYLRDISDYKQLCPSCHKKMDLARKKEKQNA